MKKTEMLYQLKEDIQKLEQADILLRNIFFEMGAYNTGKITEETWSKVRNYFDFDDSE